MRILVFLFMALIAIPCFAFDDPYAEYEAGLYDDVHPTNDQFYSVYYQNKIKKAFRDMEKKEEALLIDASNAQYKTGKDGSIYVASPIIHPDSGVKEVYIKNEMNNDIYVKQN